MALADAPARPRPASAGGRAADPRTRGSGPARPEPQPRWGTSALLAVGLLIALWGLHPLLQGISWWLASGAFVVLVLGAAAITRALVATVWVPSAVAAIVAVVAFTVAYGDFTGLLLVIPTPETAERIGALVAAGSESIQQQGVPADPVLGIVFLIAILAVIAALFADAVAIPLASPALVSIPLAAILVVTVVIRDGDSDAAVWIGVAACFLALLRGTASPAPRPTTVAVGAAVIALSLLVPNILPPVTQESTRVGGGFGARLNPLIDLGADLRSPNAVTVLEYTTPSDQPVYLRTATYDDFAGRQWKPNTVSSQRTENTIDDFPVAPGLGDGVVQRQQTVDVEIRDLGGLWLPVPYPAESIEGLRGRWLWEPSGLSVRSVDSSVSGQEYTVAFDEPQPTAEQLAAAGDVIPEGMERYLELPERDETVLAAAQEVAGSGATPYDRAVLLQEWFRTEFSYSTTAPVEDGYDGSAIRVLPQFLQARSGYCVHFASAMAVMSRMLGIPARVVTGFQPGAAVDAIDADDGDRFRVSSKQAHAWPELYFEGVGWVRFEPTPGQGVVPAYSEPTPVDDPNTPDIDESTTTPTPEVPSALPSTGPDRPDPEQALGPDSTTTSVSSAPFVAGGIVLGVLALLLVPFAMRRVRRLARFSRLRDRRAAPAAAWAEVRETARDHGWAAPSTETVREFAERLGMVLVDRSDAVLRLRDAIETEVYAPPGGSPVSPDDLRSVLHGIAERSDTRTRLRAALLPPSLVERWLPGLVVTPS